MPPTVQRAKQFSNRFTAISIPLWMLGPIGSFIGMLALMPDHLLLAFVFSAVLSAGFMMIPILLWGERVKAAQRVLKVWHKIEEEKEDAHIDRQLRMEALTTTSPIPARTRPARQSSTLR